MSGEQLKVAFMGTPEFSVPALLELYNNSKVDLKLVISMPDRPAGRGNKLQSPAVAQFAKEKGITLLQTPNINNENIKETFKKLDLILVFAFAQFIKEDILSAPQYGCFNIHTSLLPKYRGAAPIQYALLHGDKIGGASIQRMVKKMDAGDVVFSEEVNIDEGDDFFSYAEKLIPVTVTLTRNLINGLSDNSLIFNPQNENNVSFAPTIKKEEGFIDFTKDNFELINNKRRAYAMWPGIYTFLNEKRLKLLEINKSDQLLKPGQISNKNGLHIGCADGAVELIQVQLEGKKLGSGKDLINGFKEVMKLTEYK